MARVAYNKSKVVAGVAALTASLISTGCGVRLGNATRAGSAAALSITPSSLALSVGQVSQLQVTASGSSSGNAATNCTWSSSNANVLSVDANGNVLAIAAGVSLVQASCAGGVAMASAQVMAVGGPPQNQGSGVYQWTAPTAGGTNSLGTLTLVPTQGSKIQLLHPTIKSSLGTLHTISSSWDNSGQNLTITYAVNSRALHVILSPLVQKNQVTIALAADAPVISSVDTGQWTSTLQAKKIAVPYYTGNVWYLAGMGQYGNAWWDWHSTGASDFNGTAAEYAPRTDGSLAPMHEQLVVTVSPDVDDVFPFPGNPVSPYMTQLAGRMVVDVWTVGFSGIQQGLQQLGDYGVSNCAVLIHDWQHAGYDNALPEHYTANESLGGESALNAAVAAGKADNCLVALHENYVDYYPNYPEFDTSAIALTGTGDWIQSWKNGLGIQSYATKPLSMIKNAANQSPAIHERYGTTASYLDVNSAASISFHVDMNARQAGAGALTSWTQANASLWTYERQTHEGPVFGEGLDHWYYSGLLDGVEAQAGAGFPQNGGESLPLFVDFDLLRIHPFQVNHGMGYYTRWVKSGSAITTTSQMDAYRMQEVAFGHAPFLDATNWNDIVHAFEEGNLVTPVAASYGTAHAASIQYRLNDYWVSPAVAVKANQFSAVQITYDNGLGIAANASSSSLTWQGLTLPQYGWAAKGDGILAYTAMCGNTVCDYAETSSSLFANARNQTDLRIGGGAAQPSVASLKANANRRFSIAYNWQVYHAIPANYKAFIHFVNDNALNVNDGIVFQDDHAPAEPTSKWMPGNAVSDGPWSLTIPSSLSDGTYSIRMGLYDPQSGNRILLAGNDDGTERYIVGYLTISGGGSAVSFAPPPSQPDDPRLNPSSSVVNFGTVQTDGMISIRQEGDQWVLRPFPRSRAFTVLIDGSRFAMPATVQAVGGNLPTVTPIPQGQYWQLPLSGAKSYSWPVSQ